MTELPNPLEFMRLNRKCRYTRRPIPHLSIYFSTMSRIGRKLKAILLIWPEKNSEMKFFVPILRKVKLILQDFVKGALDMALFSKDRILCVRRLLAQHRVSVFTHRA